MRKFNKRKLVKLIGIIIIILLLFSRTIEVDIKNSFLKINFGNVFLILQPIQNLISMVYKKIFHLIPIRKFLLIFILGALTGYLIHGWLEGLKNVLIRTKK